MNLTLQQKRALRDPCYEAEETSRPGFFWRAIDPTVTLLLTMNIGLE
jgi:hypothetical protein